MVAEAEGFEPSREREPPTRFPGVCLRPLGQASAAQSTEGAGFADAAVTMARRLGADVPDGVAACPLAWSHWADRLAATRPPEPEQ